MLTMSIRLKSDTHVTQTLINNTMNNIIRILLMSRDKKKSSKMQLVGLLQQTSRRDYRK